eukprot:3291505-Amphidinium_carterae.1
MTKGASLASKAAGSPVAGNCSTAGRTDCVDGTTGVATERSQAEVPCWSWWILACVLAQPGIAQM